MHLSKKHGLSVTEIENDGFSISGKIKMMPKGDTMFDMAKALGDGINQYDAKPDQREFAEFGHPALADLVNDVFDVPGGGGGEQVVARHAGHRHEQVEAMVEHQPEKPGQTRYIILAPQEAARNAAKNAFGGFEQTCFLVGFSCLFLATHSLSAESLMSTELSPPAGSWLRGAR